jgi:hypothetical protein
VAQHRRRAAPAPQDLPALIAARYGLAPAAPSACAVVSAGSLGLFALSSRDSWQPGPLSAASPSAPPSSPAGTSAATSPFAEDPETLAPAFLATNSGRMESLSFVAPYAYSLELLMLWTDASRTSASASPPPPASLPAPCRRRRQPQLPHRRLPRHPDLVRHLAGAALMGFGGVTALGCTIGQGLSGLSTLSAGAALTVAGIITGRPHPQGPAKNA